MDAIEVRMRCLELVAKDLNLFESGAIDYVLNLERFVLAAGKKIPSQDDGEEVEKDAA